MSKFFLWLSLPMGCFGALNGNGDFQFWARADVVEHVNQSWQFKLIQEGRWGNHASFFYNFHVQAQAVYTPNAWLRLTPGYRQVWRRTEAIGWHPIYIPFFDFTWQTKVLGCDLKDRSRIEYTMGNSGVLPWLYRNRFRFILPPFIQERRARAALFVDNEFFWREGQGINENRISTGLMALLQESVGGQLFYMYRLQKGEESWIYNNIVETVILYSF